MHKLDQIIRSHPFWEGLNPRHFPFLNRCATFAKFGVDQPILHAGVEANHFYLICRGRVALETFVPGKGAITMETLAAGEALGWSWLFPPYRWHFSACSLDRTETVAFAARHLRDYAEESHDFGYQLTRRVGQVVWQRLQAARLQLVNSMVLAECDCSKS
jgi:CRP/FNR family transcriptional regulator, cyclic AMP receptor protein